MKRDPVRASVLATKIIPNVAADLAKELGVSRTTLWRMSKRLEQQKEQQT